MVSKIYKNICSFFSTTTNISIKFSCDTKDLTKISLKYNNINNPEYIATIIYALNNGLFLDQIVNILVNNLKSKKDKDITYKILSKLDSLYITDQQNELIIKPLETFDKNVK